MTLDIDGTVYELYTGTITARLDAAAARWGDRTGWVFADREVTFAEAKEYADKVAAGLLDLGVRRGDKVALWTPNLFEWWATALGAMRIGALVVPMNTRFKEFEAAHVLGHSDASVLIYQPGFLDIDFDGLLQQVAPGIEIADGGHVSSEVLPRLRRVITIGESRHPTLDWAALLDAPAVDVEALEQQLDPSDPVYIQFTSGTTSAPKGALLTHVHVANFAVELYLRLGVRPGEAIFNTQPFYHSGGAATLPVPLAIGCNLVVPHYYTPESTMRAIEKHRCVTRGGILTMFVMEMEHPDFHKYDRSSLRCAWTGGAPDLMDRVREVFGIELIQLYGATEGNGCLGDLDMPWEIRRLPCAGRPMTGAEVKIVHPETHEELPVGEIGDVWMRGPMTMLGYYKDPERTAEAMVDGWVRVGDLGSFDENGYFTFAGRLKDMIRVGGENTSAEEVELVVMQHPAVQQAQVIGVPDRRLGEVPLAFVELRPGAEASAEDIIAHCKARAANFRVPRHVRFVTEWPYTGSGKLAKGELRESVAEEFGLLGAVS
ncbi:AMP-binding protein [Amycolatopsis deserti]|uniref:AMP-binding protein n=1 Tax=Amycolatopsis deserti TaxID=185696 RepID=A0ABQ3IHH2_9PSEU|nr:AMP-binding protein [Amycolatopsis deserti]GHE80575.1 AMP-binding protein [Amycolatopsis deserti]